MKKILLTLAVGTLALAASAGTLDVISVNASNVTCMLSTNCTLTTYDHETDDFDLPNSRGDGILESRVIRGGAGSAGEGLYTYLYRIDLTGVTANNTNLQGCYTNAVRCRTNEVDVKTNVVVCQTNVIPATNRLVCTTNRVPGTNINICFTNSLPATNIVRCFTNAGAVACFTNFIPATNFVSCFTITIPASNVVVCSVSNFPALTNITCRTNRVSYETNVGGCTTNSVPCPGAAPCISSFSIKFGTPVTLGVPGSNGTSTGQVFAITTGGTGSIAPTSITQTGNVITVSFATPICPGDSSVFFGLVSSNAPHEVDAKLHRTDLSTEEPDALAPDLKNPPVSCDFTALRNAILQLGSSDLLAPNDNSREGRRKSLLNAVDAAIKEANEGDADDARDELDELWDKVKDNDGKWFSTQAAAQLRALTDTLRQCLKDAEEND